jgi:hypothetical protein
MGGQVLLGCEEETDTVGVQTRSESQTDPLSEKQLWLAMYSSTNHKKSLRNSKQRAKNLRR